MSISGDFNNDGKLDAQDINLLRQLLTDNPGILQHLTPEDKAMLDFNQDGVIDREDLARLCSKILNQPYINPDINNKLANLRNKLGR
jgi:hypothetical protein